MDARLCDSIMIHVTFFFVEPNNPSIMCLVFVKTPLKCWITSPENLMQTTIHKNEHRSTVVMLPFSTIYDVCRTGPWHSSIRRASKLPIPNSISLWCWSGNVSLQLLREFRQIASCLEWLVCEAETAKRREHSTMNKIWSSAEQDIISQMLLVPSRTTYEWNWISNSETTFLIPYTYRDFLTSYMFSSWDV